MQLNELENLKTFYAMSNQHRNQFPLNNSYIASDILFTVIFRDKLQIKDLFLSLPHSYTAVRLHYNRLLVDGWLELEGNLIDRRIKYIRPSRKLIELLNSFSIYLQKNMFEKNSSTEHN